MKAFYKTSLLFPLKFNTLKWMGKEKLCYEHRKFDYLFIVQQNGILIQLKTLMCLSYFIRQVVKHRTSHYCQMRLLNTICFQLENIYRINIWRYFQWLLRVLNRNEIIEVCLLWRRRSAFQIKWEIIQTHCAGRDKCGRC